MSAPQGIAPGKNPIWALAFLGQVHRYRTLASKFWWVVLLTVSLAVCAVAWYQIQRPLAYLSTGSLAVSVESSGVNVGVPGTAAYQLSIDDLIANQIIVLKKSPQIGQMVAENLSARYPDMHPVPVRLDFLPVSTFLNVNATSTDPVYTQRYLQATLDSYLTYRKQQRSNLGGEQLDKIRERIAHMEQVLKDDDNQLVAYQRDNKTVFSKVDTGDTTLADLRKKRADLQEKYDQLMIMTPEQGLDRSTTARRAIAVTADDSAQSQGMVEAGNAEADYRNARAQITQIQALKDGFPEMRPKHPKIMAFNAQINSYQQQISNLLDYSRKRLEYQRKITQSQIELSDKQIKEYEQSKMGKDLLRIGFDNLQEQKRRDEATYDGLKKALAEGDLGGKTNLDPIRLSEPASPALLMPINWAKSLGLAFVAGLGVGIGILLLLEQMDDRMTSVSAFQSAFSEQIVGQIPRDESDNYTEMLRPDDQRHQLVESFRNLRSTLLYMPIEGKQPKTLLVTSAVPNEGKSTLSCNLALIMAFAGKKTLLIDADLRRGAVHQSFGVTRDPGLTDVLGHNVNWKLAIRTTGIENLHVLPRGRNVPQPSEYLLKPTTDALLRELYDLYDYIIIDSSPILAADDTASLAPKIDATLFVVRLSYTSAKMTRKSLDVLYKRGANIPGLILNQVDTRSPEFVYYQYQEYYHTARDEDDQDGGGSAVGAGAGSGSPKPTADVR